MQLKLCVVLVLLGLLAVNAISVNKAGHHKHGGEGKNKKKVFNLVEAMNSGKGKGHSKDHAEVKIQGVITLAVSNKAQKVTLPKNEQQCFALQMDDSQSSLAQYGFKYWRPTPAGFNFLKHAPKDIKSKKEEKPLTDDIIVCEAAAANNKGDHVELTFNCEQMMDKMRFSKIKKEAKQVPWGYVDPYQYGYYIDPRTTAWTTCPYVNGAYVPYGWVDAWGTWNPSYQYYIISPQGYYACPALDGIYCSGSIMFYPTTLQPVVTIG